MSTPRLALVTGGNRGLGFEVCRQLGMRGCQVLIGARDRDKGDHAVALLRGEGYSVSSLELDMGDTASIAAACDRVVSNYDGLDILINNAAVLDDLNIQPTQVNSGILRESFEVNFFGPWQLTRSLSPLLRARSGRIINMSTQVATLNQLADPASPLKDDICPSYQASKIALNAMTVLFAKELAPFGVKVNSVCPGWVLTDMGHEELPDYGESVRPQSPAEAVAAYLWLSEAREDLPTGGFFTSHTKVPW